MEKLTIIQKPSMAIIGIACRTSNAPEKAQVDIPKLWEKFYAEEIAQQIPNKASNDIIALYCDYEGDYTEPYTVVIGCPVSVISEIPEEMVAKIIPAGSYAIFHAVGEHPKTLIETWQHIWKQKDLQRTYTGDYEVYGKKFTESSPPEVEVFIATLPEKQPFVTEDAIQRNKEKFQALRNLGLPPGQYAITGSGALGIRNVREIADIDIIVTDNLWNDLAKKHGIVEQDGIQSISFPGGIVEALGKTSFAQEEGSDTAPSIEERIANAEVIEGLPFESLQHALYFKHKMGRHKDLRDIAMIEAILDGK